MNNIKAGLFYSRIFAQSERVLCCLALQKQVLIASNNSIEGLELHSFMFSDHVKLKLSGNVIEQLGILLSLFYLHMRSRPWANLGGQEHTFPTKKIVLFVENL